MNAKKGLITQEGRQAQVRTIKGNETQVLKSRSNKTGNGKAEGK